MVKPPPKKKQRFEKQESTQKSNGKSRSVRYADVRKKATTAKDEPKKPAQVFERVRQADPAQKRRDESRPNNPTQLKSLRGIVREKGKARAELSALEPAAVSSKSKPAALIEAAEESHKPTTFKIIAGSYEKLLYGIEGTFPSSDPKPTLTPIFIFPAHVGSVRSVSASPSNGKWLATGSSADEVVKVWNLRQRKEVGGLFQHTGSITHITFPSPHHLLSCSEDGTIVLYRTKDWAVLRIFKGHKGKVNCVAVHPSGKVALSVGVDRTIRMWDFMRGNSAGSTKIYKEAELVRWSTKGDKFAVQTLNNIDIFSTQMLLLCQITHTARIQDLQFVARPGDSTGDEVLLVAGEDKKVAIYQESGSAASGSKDDDEQPEASPSTISYKVIGHFIGHDSRVKALATLPITLPSGAQTTYLSTIGSDGKIHLYDLIELPPSSKSTPELPQLTPIATYDTKGSRLTSLTMAGETMAQTAGKRKRTDEDEDEEDEEAGWTDASSDEEQPNGHGEVEEDDETSDGEQSEDGGWYGIDD